MQLKGEQMDMKYFVVCTWHYYHCFYLSDLMQLLYQLSLFFFNATKLKHSP